MAAYPLVALIAGLIGYHMGWAGAHLTVAAECRRLGGFFVGTAVFKCTEVADRD